MAGSASEIHGPSSISSPASTSPYSLGPITLRNRDNSFGPGGKFDAQFAYLGNAHPPQVALCHPAYPDDCCLILTLPGFDHPRGGVHFGLVMEACYVLSNNNRTGWLAATREGAAIKLDYDEVLMAGMYFYVIADPPPDVPRTTQSYGGPEGIYNWPVVTSFSAWTQSYDWSAPTDNGLRHWFTPDYLNYTMTYSQAKPQSEVQVRDSNTCVATKSQDATEQAHVVAKVWDDWAMAQGLMRQHTDSLRQFKYVNWHENPTPYNSNIPDEKWLSSSSNLLTLRKDLHHQIDHGRCVCFIKKGGFSIHYITSSPGVLELHHNVPMGAVKCHPVWLYCRFAWSILTLTGPFLSIPPSSRYCFKADISPTQGFLGTTSAGDFLLYNDGVKENFDKSKLVARSVTPASSRPASSRKSSSKSSRKTSVADTNSVVSTSTDPSASMGGLVVASARSLPNLQQSRPHPGPSPYNTLFTSPSSTKRGRDTLDDSDAERDARGSSG